MINEKPVSTLQQDIQELLSYKIDSSDKWDGEKFEKFFQAYQKVLHIFNQHPVDDIKGEDRRALKEILESLNRKKSNAVHKEFEGIIVYKDLYSCLHEKMVKEALGKITHLSPLEKEIGSLFSIEGENLLSLMQGFRAIFIDGILALTQKDWHRKTSLTRRFTREQIQAKLEGAPDQPKEPPHPREAVQKEVKKILTEGMETRVSPVSDQTSPPKEDKESFLQISSRKIPPLSEDEPLKEEEDSGPQEKSQDLPKLEMEKVSKEEGESPSQEKSQEFSEQNADRPLKVEGEADPEEEIRKLTEQSAFGEISGGLSLAEKITSLSAKKPELFGIQTFSSFLEEVLENLVEFLHSEIDLEGKALKIEEDPNRRTEIRRQLSHYRATYHLDRLTFESMKWSSLEIAGSSLSLKVAELVNIKVSGLKFSTFIKTLQDGFIRYGERWLRQLETELEIPIIRKDKEASLFLLDAFYPETALRAREKLEEEELKNIHHEMEEAKGKNTKYVGRGTGNLMVEAAWLDGMFKLKGVNLSKTLGVFISTLWKTLKDSHSNPSGKRSTLLDYLKHSLNDILQMESDLWWTVLFSRYDYIPNLKAEALPEMKLGDFMMEVLLKIHPLALDGFEHNRIVTIENKEGLRMVEKIGSGAMGIIYKALRKDDQQKVAVKVMNESDLERVVRTRREFTTLQELREKGGCANIIEAYTFGDVRSYGQQKVVYIVMEYIDGKDLKEVFIEFGKRIQPYLVAHLGRCLAGALIDAHEAGIIHRDIKPSNIMIRGGTLEEIWEKPEGVKIVDFGCARPQFSKENMKLTQTNEIIGTMHYMSLEQARGHVNEKSDLYSVGATLYEMLSGRVPDNRTIIQRIGRPEFEVLPPLRGTKKKPLTPQEEELSGIVLDLLDYKSPDALVDARTLYRKLHRLIVGWEK